MCLVAEVLSQIRIYVIISAPIGKSHDRLVISILDPIFLML